MRRGLLSCLLAPSGVDPGNLIYKTKNTPKVVGGCTPKCTEIAAAMYETVLEAPVYKVSSPAIAEMEKILENTYRNVNIGLINELASSATGGHQHLGSNRRGQKQALRLPSVLSRPRSRRPLHPARSLLSELEGARIRLPHLDDRIVHDGQRPHARVLRGSRRPHPQHLQKVDERREDPCAGRRLQAEYCRLPREPGDQRHQGASKSAAQRSRTTTRGCRPSAGRA